MKPGKTGLARIIDAGKYSAQGFQAAYKHEAAFRQELFACLILLPAAFLLATNAVELIVLIGSLFLVLICEMLNSAIEAAVDRSGDEIHILSGRAKDMGSAVVSLALLNVIFCWSTILLYP